MDDPVKRSASVAALAAVGIATTGALALGVAAPANAAIYNLSDYAPTLPYSVLDTLPDEDQKAWTDQTRSGVVGTKPVVPVGPVPTYSQPSGVKLPGILGGVGMLLEVAGQSEVFYGADTSQDLWWKNPAAARPSWIPEDEWGACAHGGDAGNFFDGLRDWMASLQGAAVGGGYDCAAIREDWLTEPDADYEPVNVGGDPVRAAYPLTGYSTDPYVGTTSFTFDVVWSDTLMTYSTVTKKEGWLLLVRADGPDDNFLMRSETRGPDGQLLGETREHQISAISTTAGYRSTNPVCALWDQCVVLSRVESADWLTHPDNVTYPIFLKPGQSGYSGYSTSETVAPPLPYVNPMTGTYSPVLGALDVVMMTTVLTQSGNRYSCQTAPFKEDAPTIPRPCYPDVPEWEIETERITEMVPLKDVPTYVPTTTPGREIQRVVRPGPIQDWEQAHPECGEQTCKVYLMWIDEQGTERNCYDFPEHCEGWYTKTDKATKFKCRYGTNLAAAALLALAECTHLAQLFEPNAVDSGQAYPDPSKDPAASPGGQTSTAPAPATPPGSGVNDPTKTRQCWPTGWGMFNPFEWVYLPVKCALEWAFVPRQSVINGNNGMINNGWNNTLIRQVMMAGETLLAALPDDGGCGGIPLNVTLPGGVQVSETLLNSCGPPLAAAAATTKGILSGSIIVATFLACTRYLGVIFGFVGYGQVLEQRAAERAERTGKGNA
jgi:hypothetical protein